MTIARSFLLLLAMVLIGLLGIECRRWRHCRTEGMPEIYPGRRLFRRLASGLLFLASLGALFLIESRHPWLEGAKAQLAAMGVVAICMIAGIVLTILDFFEIAKSVAEATENDALDASKRLMKELAMNERLRANDAPGSIQAPEPDGEP